MVLSVTFSGLLGWEGGGGMCSYDVRTHIGDL